MSVVSETAAVKVRHTSTTAAASYQAGEDQYDARDHDAESNGQPKPTVVVATGGWMRLID